MGGAGLTTPLDQGASPVLKALKLMKRRIRLAIGHKVPFNEVLSAAYMEHQAMAVRVIYYSCYKVTIYGV